MRMENKLTMKKTDVQSSIALYVKRSFESLDVKGRNIPESIKSVLATIQDKEYLGAGNYNVMFDIFGTELLENGDKIENVHYKAICGVNVSSNSEGEPMVELNESLILSKQS